jgi:hypothetical protein
MENVMSYLISRTDTMIEKLDFIKKGGSEKQRFGERRQSRSRERRKTHCGEKAGVRDKGSREHWLNSTEVWYYNQLPTWAVDFLLLSLLN